jgi:hypothetical protein
MRRLAVLFLTAGFLSGCDDYQLAETSKEVVVPRAEYEQLKAAVAASQAKQVGRYQLHEQGFRTWRLDTATGRSCLLLTSDADWKGKGGEQGSCYEEDLAAARERHRLYPSLYDVSGDPIPQK